ncbi:MAG TPA: OPT/YSL family transporter [Polyangiaceae bacterium]
MTPRPYIPAEKTLRELTPAPLVLGTLLGVIFGASSLYLVLKVGLTVSASIPVAVISITLFRIFKKLGLRDATILEDNIVQTAGSAGESIAFGIGVTMPAIMILGFDLEITRVALVAVLGGLLGILMMIPLRRALIVDQHEELKYPEGTACAEVLKAGASEESRKAHFEGLIPQEHGELEGRTPLEQDKTDLEKAPPEAPEHEMGAGAIFAGFGIGLVYKAAMEAFKSWKDIPEKVFGAPYAGASVSAEISPELLGVGYIIGPRIASIMCAGGVLAYLVLIPMIKFFGDALPMPLAPGHELISKMGPDEIRGAYVLYIGAGAVAAGGIISLGRSLPTIWHGLRAGLGDLRRGQGEAKAATNREVPRTERDLPIKVVLWGSLALVIAIVLATPLRMNIAGAVLIVLFGFLFVTVSSRLTGEIGSSSNPISGMTVATLLLTCLIFLVIGWTGPTYYVTALSVGAIVCIAASNGGTTSQDLKTGFLIGATPRAQQIAILVGALASAIALGPILLKLNDAATVYVPQVEMVDGKPADAFPKTMHVDPKTLDVRERLTGPQAAGDTHAYLVWNNQDESQGPPAKYFVGDDGTPKYLVDPGINGTHATRPDGTKVTKFDAPKATLMSYIIKGILNRQLPWGLVLLGVMISVVLEMSGIPSLAFAVGVYLPLSSSTPILVGGAVRWLVDKHTRKKLPPTATPDEVSAEGDKSPGVLMASGYIAGGAIAGIVIAFFAGVTSGLQAKIDAWASAHNPLFAGAHADLLSLIPFAILTMILWAAGRELIFGRRA